MNILFHFCLRLVPFEIWGIGMKADEVKVRHFVIMSIIGGLIWLGVGEVVNHKKRNRETLDSNNKLEFVPTGQNYNNIVEQDAAPNC